MLWKSLNLIPGIDYGWSVILTVVDLSVKLSMKVPWVYQARWFLCLQFVNSIFIRVSHIFLEDSRTADALFKFALNISHSVWWSSVLDFYMDFDRDDVIGRNVYWFS